MGDTDPTVNVEVEVEPAELPDSDGDGTPDAFEAGQAQANAEHAAEAADEAQETAEQAADMANAAGEVAVGAAIDNAEQDDRLARLENALIAQGETLNRVTQLLEASANLQASTIETAALTEQPDDEPPASRSWLTRKWF